MAKEHKGKYCGGCDRWHDKEKLWCPFCFPDGFKMNTYRNRKIRTPSSMIRSQLEEAYG